jgi:hypothetical protein
MEDTGSSTDSPGTTKRGSTRLEGVITVSMRAWRMVG